MVLIPIKETIEENQEFVNNPDCRDINLPLDFYKKVRFNPSWIGYCVSDGEQLIAAAGFKGKSVIDLGRQSQFKDRLHRRW